MWPNGAEVKKTTLSPFELRKMGYAIVSRKYLTAARVDREDWKEFLRKKGLAVDLMSDGDWQDHYRRIYSRDLVEVPSSYIGLLPNSNHYFHPLVSPKA